MNAAQRKILKAISEKIDEAKSALESERDDEQDKFDNLTEGLQQGERGQAIENAVSELETAIDCLDSAINAIDAAME